MNDGKGMNMDSYIPAQTFHPGVFIKEEIDERGWTQGDLAAIIGRPIQVVNELIAGKKAITADTARALGEAFGTGPEFWMNLESSWRLSQATPADALIGRRAKLFGVAPVQELVRRNWIAPAADDAVFERSVLSFMKILSIEEKPQILAAARKSSKDAVFTPSQVAWLRRAEFLAQNLQVKAFSKKQFLSAVADLRDLAGHEADVRRVPRFLAEIGVRLVVIEHLQGTKIDGAAFWLDSKSPVVALSMRYDRIDYFWYTLGHELGHVKNGDGQVFFDDDLIAAQHRDEAERLADEFASELLVPPTELDDFINRVRPLYSRQKIAGFASRMGVHPAIVIGQLQHRGEIGYWHSRPLLAKVRSILLESAIYDGWGHSIGAQGAQAK
jgi:HTH-type transcriptional regulator / antitoxin HigA